MKDLINSKINANMKKDSHTYTGNLYFYNDGFEYKANSVNSKIAFGKILYSDIKEITATKTFGLISNGILITLKNLQQLQFVVTNQKTVFNFLKSKID